MKKAYLIIGAVVLVVAAVLLATKAGPDRTSRSNKIIVITTIFPLYDMARSIGSDKAEVTLLLPPGVEAHAFEPKPSDLVKISEADIFVYTGKFMEPWANDVLKSAANRKLIVVDASNGVKMISPVVHDADEPVGSPDPHIWLDFADAKIMTMNIKAAFTARDKEHAVFYEQTTAAYAEKLNELDTRYKATLASCKSKELVYGGHYAFGYLATRYGLKYLAAQGLSPDAEPTARDLAALVDQIRKDNIKYVFYEELTSPKIAETIAHETQSKMLLLNAAHNLARDQFEQGVTFYEIMSKNLENLKTGLECR